MNKRNKFQETLKEINKMSKLLKEAYMFDGEENAPYEDNERMMRKDPRQMGKNSPMEMEEEEDPMMDEQTDGIIDEIRKLALQGIQKYSEDVDNEMYITFKKIWMMCDKCLSEKDKVEN